MGKFVPHHGTSTSTAEGETEAKTFICAWDDATYMYVGKQECFEGPYFFALGVEQHIDFSAQLQSYGRVFGLKWYNNNYCVDSNILNSVD